MSFEIHPYKLEVEGLGQKKGVLLEKDGRWGEVAPFPGRSRETLDQAVEQLKAIKQGYAGKLLPSVAFGLFGLTAPRVFKAPVCLFLMGSPQEILRTAEDSQGCKTAKVKIGSFDVATAISLVQTLLQKFRLRIDVGGKWSQEKLREFCSHFDANAFEFIEDPGFDISPFPMGADEGEWGSITVWKPMIKGLPSKGSRLVLSSSFETAVGLHTIAALAEVFEIPMHPLGIGTFNKTQQDVLLEPLKIEQGELIFPDEFRIRAI